MTTNEVKTRLAAHLREKGDFESLRTSFLSVSQEASKYGKDVETLVGSVGNLIARFATGQMTEPEFLERLRVLSEAAPDNTAPAIVLSPYCFAPNPFDVLPVAHWQVSTSSAGNSSLEDSVAFPLPPYLIVLSELH